MSDWNPDEEISTELPRISVKLIINGKDVLTKKGMNNLIFASQHPVEVDGEAMGAQTLVVSGSPDDIHTLAVELLKMLSARGELVRALMCFATDAHNQHGRRHHVSQDPKGIMSEHATLELLKHMERSARRKEK